MWARIWAFLDWCFFGPASARPGAAGQLLRALRYPYAVVRDLSYPIIRIAVAGTFFTHGWEKVMHGDFATFAQNVLDSTNWSPSAAAGSARRD